MRTYFVTLILSAVTSFLITPLARRLAFRWGAVDLPSERKIHTAPMPRWGGLAVFAGFSLPWIGLFWVENQITATLRDYETLFLTLMLGALLMLGLGVYDDVKGANATQKLLVQTLIAIGLYCGGYQISRLSSPFGAPFELGWLSLPVSVLWIVGLTNAINLLDGIDGLVPGVTACIALSLAVINILSGQVLVALLALCLAGACLGFLPYNFSPARIFLGDSGSLFIGVVLAGIGILSLFKAATTSLIVVPLLLFGVPLFDTASVVVGRLARRVPLFQADQSHVHHRLLKRGFNQRQAAIVLYGITLFLGGVAVVLTWQQAVAIAIGSGGAVLVLALLIRWRWISRHREEKLPPESPEE